MSSSAKRAIVRIYGTEVDKNFLDAKEASYLEQYSGIENRP
jgi:hypothetical protein